MFVKFQVCGWGVQGVGGVGCKSVRLQDGAACSLSQGSYNQKEKQKKVKKNDTDKLSLITQQTTTTLPMPRGTNLLMRCWTRSLNPISALTSLLNLNLYLQPLLGRSPQICTVRDSVTSQKYIFFPSILNFLKITSLKYMC